MTGGRVVYALAVLAGAMLVFKVQPLAGRLLLPIFGGGASVWTACMFFFQAMLLAGYAYAFVVSTFLVPRAQAVIHALVLAGSVLFLPIAVPRDIGPLPGNPGMLVMSVLAASIAFPFVMLASTAPLIQRWSSITRPGKPPWRLYALSNAGALAALVAYPVLVEPRLSLEAQMSAWSAGYLLFAAVSLAACLLLWRHPARAGVANAAVFAARSAPVSGTRRSAEGAMTVLLAAAGVAMLLAVTAQVTHNVAPVPFLWVVPLAIYLLTYIICFSGERWYDRSIWGSLFIVAGTTLLILWFFGASFPLVPVVTAWLLVLFCICMLCHGELYRLRPAPERLGAWYLLIALGGALGGAFVSFAAPILFTRYWEAPLAAYAAYLAFGFLALRPGRPVEVRRAALQARIDLWSRRLFAAGWAAGVLIFPVTVAGLDTLRPRYDLASTRNFYGIVNVRDVTADGPPRRVLVDGTTIHGYQLLDERLRQLPTSYYGPDTGVELTLRLLERPAEGLAAGIVGLGTGTLAAYGEAGDRFRFYELNPAVIDLARTHFSFLRDSAATIEIVPGDARISLEHELATHGSGNFDLLVIDAFTSDAIPVHLLTLEALTVYLAHLRPDGIVAFHVTNSYLDLAPVVADLASALGRRAVHVSTVVDTGVSSRADWVLVALPDRISVREGTDGVMFTSVAPPPEERLWTDDYSNLFGVLRR